ncbi:MAG: DUF4833 domain-containing protein [Myxococcota bacterium]|nr:DUF4833 domain-containing protein [Myxococcota bacterium]
MSVDRRPAVSPRRGPSARALAALWLCLAWISVPATGEELRVASGAPSTLARNAPATQPLFRIERSKNANVVQYDALITPAGTLDPNEPVDAYWVKVEKGGLRKELDWMERRLAYGFSSRLQRPDRLELEMAADIGRVITVRHDGSGYRAETLIDGRPAVIERVYVESIETALLPQVVFIDLVGTDVETGERRSERLLP